MVLGFARFEEHGAMAAKKLRRKAKKAARKIRAAPRAAAKAKKRPQHKLSVSHHSEADFKAGLRSHAVYRDLGIADATSGMAVAHVIRHVRPAEEGGAGEWHYHVVDFQMIYVLKGWIATEFDGLGTHRMREGSCWLQPPGIVHVVRGYSDDCELLEIVMPADFATVTVE
jgi:mannose-6-phosphate isomerase-like protein (cupin superfamily)